MAKKRTPARRSVPVRSIKSTASKSHKQTKKQIAATRKAISNTKRSIKSAAKAGRLAAERNELSYIENLLGEDFTSLREARAAVKREVKSVSRKQKKQVTSIVKDITKFVKSEFKLPPSKAAKKKIVKKIEQVAEKTFQAIANQFKIPVPHITPRKRSYELVELGPDDKTHILRWIHDTNYTNQLDLFVHKPGTLYAAEIPYTTKDGAGNTITGWSRTFNTAPSLNVLFRTLAGYADKDFRKGISAQQIEDWMKHIKIVQWTGGQNGWAATRKGYLNRNKTSAVVFGRKGGGKRKSKKKKGA